MDLRQLTYFQMVCRLKSFTKTAEQLNISQPSISIAIQKLEEEVGVKLLERNRKQVIITPAGEVFLYRINDILNAIENVTTEMHNYSISKKEEIRIGIPPMIGSYLLPYLFTEYKAQYPNVELIIQELGSTEIQALIESGELDIGLIVLREKQSVFEIEQLKNGEILLILSPEHPLNKLSTVPFELLKEESFILMIEGTNIRNIIMDTCSTHGFKPEIVHTSTQIATISKLVASGIGISFMPDLMVNQYDNLVGKPFSNPLFIDTGLVWRKNKLLSSSTKELINFIKQKSEMDK